MKDRLFFLLSNFRGSPKDDTPHERTPNPEPFFIFPLAFHLRNGYNIKACFDAGNFSSHGEHGT